jgi:FixJ family two-component response regulator
VRPVPQHDVAIVDDDASMRAALARLLRVHGINSRKYPSALAFLEALPSGMPDCLIVDVNMPGMSGIELQRALLNGGIRVPTIVITGRDDKGIAATAASLGAVAFLLKPVPQDALIAAVHSTWDRDPVQASLAESLAVLVQAAIAQAGGNARAAFFLADESGRSLHLIAGMTEAYARHVDGFAIGPQSLACGLAVATRQPVLTRDVMAEPRWQPWLWLAKEFDYRACWSFPIETANGKVVGTFAMYHGEPTEATARHLDLAAAMTHAAASIIAGTDRPPAH